MQEKCIQGRKKYANMELAQKTKKCARERQKYANMKPEQKKARIAQIAANRELKHNTLCKESIAMENLAYVATAEEVSKSIRRRLHKVYMHGGSTKYTTFLCIHSHVFVLTLFLL